MHELAATQALLDIALEAAARSRAQRIDAVDIVIGELTSMVDDSVRFYFELLSRDTPAAGATLRVRREPATASCAACGHQAAVRPPLSPSCGRCGALAVRVAGGRAFHVESIEVADAGAAGN